MPTSESSTYFWEWDPTRPAGATDKVYNGDDEFRQIKGNMQNSFPNIQAIIFASDVEINLLVGKTTFGDIYTFNQVDFFSTDITSLPKVDDSINIGSASKRLANIFATTFTGTTFTGQSTTALYADLAEKYLADDDYAPGTVVMFGGEFEVTVATRATKKVAGVVSTAPGFTMNEGLTGDYPVLVALAGRVPVKVQGKVEKGDLMIAGKAGFAEAMHPDAHADEYVAAFIGKAIQDFNLDGVESPQGLPLEGVIEVAVGIK